VVSALEAMSDYAAGTLYQQQPSPYNFNPYISLPPAGSCTTYSVSNYTPSDLPMLSNVAPTGKGLNAGNLGIAASSGAPITNPPA
jgi:hypothetical protein